MYLITYFFIYDISYKHPPSPDYFSRSFPPPKSLSPIIPRLIIYPPFDRGEMIGGGVGANDRGKLICEENHRR